MSNYFGVSDRLNLRYTDLQSVAHHSATDTLVDKCGKNHSSNRKEQFCNNQIPDETGCEEIKYSSNYHETFLRQSLRRCFLSQPFRLVAKRFCEASLVFLISCCKSFLIRSIFSWRVKLHLFQKYQGEHQIPEVEFLNQFPWFYEHYQGHFPK